jgi:hypothetical protein
MLPTSNRVGSVMHMVGCWPSITVGAGRNPPSEAICTQSGPAVSLFASTGIGGALVRIDLPAAATATPEVPADWGLSPRARPVAGAAGLTHGIQPPAPPGRSRCR